MFSVVIPLYNKENVILRTISSVLTQTFKEFEVIIVNDGSTDKSVAQIKDFFTDDRLKLIEQKNQGVSAARNTGIRNSNNKYIAFLDADDEWLPYFLETIQAAIEKFPNAGFFGTSSWHRNLVTGESSNSTILKYAGKMMEIDYFMNPHTMPHTSACVISKQVISKLDIPKDGFPEDMKLREDMTFFYKIAFLTSFVYIGIPLSIRNNNVIGQTTGASEKDKLLRLNDIIAYYNRTYGYWKLNSFKNKKFKAFRKYEIRHHVITFLRKKDFHSLKFFLDNLDNQSKKLIPAWEFRCYLKKWLLHLNKPYILFTKILWRSRGNPR